MTPFPETEIMTLKRLEVALKKSDFKLLKDGAYKLHEKYHSGFRFQYIDLLKDILYNTNNSNAPMEIKDILIPTLEDILTSFDKSEKNGITSPYENQNRVSALTSLEYTNRQNQQNAQMPQITQTGEKLSAFDVFTPDKPDNAHFNQLQQFRNNEQIVNKEADSNGNFEKFELPKINPMTTKQNPQAQTVNQIHEQNPVKNNTSTVNATKTISIFYAQNNSEEKNKNIKKYSEILAKLGNEKIDFLEIIKLISEINTQSNSNVAELAAILEQIQNRGIKINLITNSTNANLAGLVEKIKIPYKFNSNEEKINILPLFGLTNMFKCSQCKEEYVDLNDNINPYVIQCPKCKSAMLPNFSCKDTKINLNYYNNSIINLANSDVWLILYPSAAENSMLDILRSAITLNKNVKNIFICDKDINAKEIYKNKITQIDKNVKINIEINALEEFLKLV